jgi:hypothetical protein
MRKTKSITERFWSKVEVRGEDDCWLWTASKDECGYGKLGIGGAKWDRAHRVAYRLLIGPISEGMEVCHSCDRPSCCNPKHLWAGTHLENMKDMALKLRSRGIRLTEGQVIEMRELSESGITTVELGQRYGIAHQHASRIINRICWKYVP